MRSVLRIPNDWEEDNGYAVVLFCVPNSPDWRGVIVGLVESICYGRTWDEKTGNIKQIQSVAREVFDTMTICNLDDLITNTDRIATALENIDGKTPEIITLADLVDDLTDNPAMSTLASFTPLLEFLIVLRDLFPTVALRVDASGLFLKLFEYFTWKAPILAELTALNGFQALQAGAQIGSTALEAILGVRDGMQIAAKRWYDTITGVIDYFGWWDSFMGLFISDGQTDPDADSELRPMVRVYNDVFVEQGALSVTNVVSVDACCQGGAGIPDTEEGVEGQPPPTGMANPDSGITDRKCKAAHYLFDQNRYLFFQLGANPPPAWYDVGQIEAFIRQIAESFLKPSLFDWIYGFYQDVALVVDAAGIDYVEIVAQMDANKNDILCGIREAINSTEVFDAFVNNVTLDATDYAMYTSVLYNTALNLPFFAIESSEEFIDAWPTPAGCAACACEVSLAVGGTWNGTTLTSYDNNGSQYASMSFDASQCGASATITAISVNAGQPDSPNNTGYRFWDKDSVLIYSSDILPSGQDLPLVNVRNFVVADTVAPSTQFILGLTFVED